MSSQHLACSVPAHHLSNCQPLPLCHRHVSGMLLSPLQGSKWIHSHQGKWNVSKSSGYPFWCFFIVRSRKTVRSSQIWVRFIQHAWIWLSGCPSRDSELWQLGRMFKKEWTIQLFNTGFVQKKWCNLYITNQLLSSMLQHVTQISRFVTFLSDLTHQIMLWSFLGHRPPPW